MNSKKFKAKIVVSLKPEVKDSKAQVLEQIIERKDYAKSPKCAVGQYFELSFAAGDEAEANEQLKLIAREILSNPVIETYEILSMKEV